jgi:hypothetical protein
MACDGTRGIVLKKSRLASHRPETHVVRRLAGVTSTHRDPTEGTEADIHSLLHAAEARQIIGSPSELRPMAPLQSARYGNRAVHYGHHERPRLYVFRDTGSAFVSLGHGHVQNGA